MGHVTLEAHTAYEVRLRLDIIIKRYITHATCNLLRGRTMLTANYDCAFLAASSIIASSTVGTNIVTTLCFDYSYELVRMPNQTSITKLPNSFY